ncbi:lamin-like protein [Arachis ipaensis]|uniref:lamin-like protein n=1 Tax=Arachis ipaensis TaxID=130454 RepID=UPI0007AEF222|nr:lamin-like protein [Arachis ipaensis]XP_025681345.1 lamin-like protein [Arachis hypogaea]QHN83648.1 Lamin-like protein [Arachis hypogaea]
MKRMLASSSPVMVLLFMVFAVLVMLPEASAKRWLVGDNMGWNSNVNYSTWVKGKHFYNGDWLFFVYDRNQIDVLEVNKKDYEKCNSDHPLHNWTTGAGRDDVPLNMTRNYYFISGKGGFCFKGMKVAIHVENLPPPPKEDDSQMADAPALPPAIAEAPTLAQPPVEIRAPASALPPTIAKATSPAQPPAETGAPTFSPERGGAPTLSSRTQVLVMAVVFAIGATWDTFIHFC